MEEAVAEEEQKADGDISLKGKENEIEECEPTKEG